MLFRRISAYSGRHVVFGKVIKGQDVVRAMENVETGENDRPVKDVVIVDCGELQPGQDDGVKTPQDGDTLPSYPGLPRHLHLTLIHFAEDSGLDFGNIEAVLVLLENVRKIGNNLFGEQKYAEALKKYQKILRYLDEMISETKG